MERILRYLDYIGTLVKEVEEGRLSKDYLYILGETVCGFVKKLYQYARSAAFPQENQACRIIKETQARFKMISNEQFGEAELEFIKDRLSNPCILELFAGDAYFEQNISAQCDMLRMHRRICSDIFKELENMQNPGNHFWVKIDHDDSWVQDEDGESGDYIRLAVLSESAMAYDNFIFTRLNTLENEVDRREVQESYRPFFMEYYIDVISLESKQREFIGRMIREAEAAGRAERNGEEEDRSRGWHSAYFAGEEEIAGEDSILFQGVSAFSASPVIYKGRKIVVETARLDSKTADKINGTYQIPANCASDFMIKKEIAGALYDVTFRGARVYKVGNGNCICLYGWSSNGKKSLLYDVGFDNHTAVREQISQMPPSYQKALKSIRRLKPDCVILSHWDADHYKACAYCGKELFECMWIAPYCMDASPNAKRLAKYLYLIGKLRFVDRSKEREINVPLNGKSILSLYVGRKLSKECLSAANCEGIAIGYENGITSSLMQGDVPYLCLPDQAGFTSKNPYDNLVVPHHGSKMDLTLLAPRNVGWGNAVICCNNNSNVENRPASGHWKALQGCYANVEVTENADCYVKLNFIGKKRMERK